jgi:hypothetical protein
MYPPWSFQTLKTKQHYVCTLHGPFKVDRFVKTTANKNPNANHKQTNKQAQTNKQTNKQTNEHYT